MDTQYVYESKAWPTRADRPRSAIEYSVKNDEPEFELKILTQDSMRITYHQGGDPPLTYTTNSNPPLLRKTLKFPQHLLLGDINVLISNMSHVLTSLDIPIEYQHRIFMEIHDTAKSMVENCSKSSNTRVLSMSVWINIVACYNYIGGSSTTLESPNESVVGCYSATTSSVDALERMIIKENDFIDYDCVVCMEKFIVGVKVIKMPCSHIYHESCVKEWLEKRSHLCPLCRFAMPCVRSSAV